MPHSRTPWSKRFFDVSVSGIGLLLSATFWVVIRISIHLEDCGLLVYGQERVGRGGTRFKNWKFRSMTPTSGREFAVRQAEHNDKRVTTVGRVLRATAMDELPQLWNIFKGDMSFVGPRPLLPEELEVNGDGEVIPLEKIPGYEARHQVIPGLKGLAQIFAPRDLPRRQKFRLDILSIIKLCCLIDSRFVL